MLGTPQKFLLRRLRRVDALVYGTPGYTQISTLLSESGLSHNVIGITKTDFSFWAAIRASLRRWPIRIPTFRDYIEEVVRTSGPKFIITFVDNDTRIWEIASSLKTPLIVIQNGIRGGPGDLDFSQNYPGKVDHFFCFNPAIGETFRQIVSIDQMHISGSLKNNAQPVRQQNRSGIVWISQFRSTDDLGQELTSKWNNLEIKACGVLLRWAKKRGLTLEVLPRSTHHQEWNFFKERLPQEVGVINRESRSPYEIIDKFQLVASFCSTLAHEAATRGASLFFFNFAVQNFDSSLRLGWPQPFDQDGPFWHCDASEESLIHDKLEKLYFSDRSTFGEKYASEVAQLMAIDVGNENLRSVLKSYK